MENRIRTTSPEIDEGYIRMIAAGWELHVGEVTESDIKTHEFKMMYDNTFKKLKEEGDKNGREKTPFKRV